MDTRRVGSVAWIVVVVMAGCGVVGFAVYQVIKRQSADSAIVASQPVAVSTMVVQSGHLAKWASVVGTLVSRNELIVAPEGAGGRITELLTDVGEFVTAGQPVVKLDDTAALIQRAQAEATKQRSLAMVKQQEALIVEGQASLREAMASARRVESLGTGIASEEVMEQRRTFVTTATARLAAAEQGLVMQRAEVAHSDTLVRDATLAVERTTLRAPAAGMVLYRPAKLGAVANAGEMLLRIAQDGEVEFAAEVTEDLLQLVCVGQPVECEAGSIISSGVVRRVAPSLDPVTRLGEVRVTLTKPDPLLRPGLSGRGRIEVAKGDGPIVPASALLHEADETVVMVVADGHARRRPIGMLLHAGSQVMVGKGLAIGEEIIARAPNFVPDGEAVTAVRLSVRTQQAVEAGPASRSAEQGH